MSKIVPKYDWYIVEEFVKDPQKAAGSLIYTMEGMSEDVVRGRVVAHGDGKALEWGVTLENGVLARPTQTEVGAYILFQDVGHKFMHGGKQYRAIKEEDIICEVEDATSN